MIRLLLTQSPGVAAVHENTMSNDRPGGAKKPIIWLMGFFKCSALFT